MSTETVTLATVVIGFVFKAWQDHAAWKRSEATAHRRRLEDIADRARIAVRLATKVEQQHAETKQMLNDNTALTAFAADRAHEALTEANNFNRKWQAVERLIDRVGADPREIEEVRDIVADTNTIVRRELTHEDPR